MGSVAGKEKAKTILHLAPKIDLVIFSSSCQHRRDSLTLCLGSLSPQLKKLLEEIQLYNLGISTSEDVTLYSYVLVWVVGSLIFIGVLARSQLFLFHKGYYYLFIYPSINRLIYLLIELPYLSQLFNPSLEPFQKSIIDPK